MTKEEILKSFPEDKYEFSPTYKECEGKVIMFVPDNVVKTSNMVALDLKSEFITDKIFSAYKRTDYLIPAFYILTSATDLHYFYLMKKTTVDPHKDHEIVENMVMFKKFRYCRTCKIETE